MSSLGDRWTQISPLIDELLDLTGDSRTRRLHEITRQHPELAAELSKMLALEDENTDFLSQPIVDASLFAPQPGQEIGPYRLVTPLGEGGMGQVWLAMRADGLYERRVALKLLRPGLGDAGLRARFTRERQILARLGHAHIARLLDAGISQDGQPYLALDYVRGDPITDYARKHSVDLLTRLQLFSQVCAAVSHAHANLVVHRDLKPSNILVTPAGDVCLLDFGIAKLLDQAMDQTEITQTESRAFTLHYAAPEQLKHEVITTMTDVYSLGVVLYELLTDCIPYELERQTDAAWEEAILSAEPNRPSFAVARLARDSGLLVDRRRVRQLAGDLDNIILKALDKQPEQRYSSVEALAQDLRRYLEGQPVHARPQGVGYRMFKYLRRHAVAVGFSMVVTGVMGIALAIVSWQATRAVSEASRAQAMQDFVIALFENAGDGRQDEGLDVRALLDAGVVRADTELANQPRARAELLGLIARLRAGLGDDSETLDLLDRQQQVLRSLGDAVPVNLALESAALRGRSLRELDRPQDCVNALGPLLASAKESTGAWPLQSAEFFSQLGRCHRQLNGADVARDLFGQALLLRRSGKGSPLLESESLTDLALVRIDEGQVADGIRALRDALAKLRAGGSERNAYGLDIWRSLGDAYGQQGNQLESEAAYRQALDIALDRFGTQHPRTVVVQLRLASTLVEKGQLDEADRLLRIAQDTLITRSGADNPALAPIDSQRGQIALARDAPADADAALTDAVRLWRLHQQLPANATDQCWLAVAEMSAGKADASDLNGRACIDSLTGRLGERGRGIAWLADAALDRGDVARARAWLNRLDGVPIVPAALADVAVVRARLALQANAADAGLRLADAQQALALEPKNISLRWQLEALSAEQSCRMGDAATGITLRREVIARASRDQPERRRLQRRLVLSSTSCEAPQ